MFFRTQNKEKILFLIMTQLTNNFIFFIQRSKNKIKEEIKRIIKKKSLKYSNQI